MSAGLSFSDLASIYAGKSKPAAGLFFCGTSSVNKCLPGKDTKLRLEKLFAARQSSLAPVRPNEWSVDKDHSFIAICCVIVDDLPHEEIWKAWLAQSNEKHSARLFVHAKEPQKVRSSWVKQHLIDVTFNPAWNSVEVIQAMLSTLDQALRYSDVTAGSITGRCCERFVFCTESCLPLCSLQETADALFAEDCSWLSAYHTPVDKYDTAASFGAVNKDIVPPKAVWKSLPGWIALNRRHAAEIIALTNLLGGWGQPTRSESAGGCTSSSTNSSTAAGAGMVVRYQGTQGTLWNKGDEPSASATKDDAGATAGAVDASDGTEETKTEERAAESGPGTTIASRDNDVKSETLPPAIPATAVDLQEAPQQLPGPALLDAWATVHAPEEVFFPTALALLGYLRDSDESRNTTGNQGGECGRGAAGKHREVKLQAVNFAEWARRGDAHPIAHQSFTVDLVRHMTAGGALFGRKFASGSVTVDEWRTVLEQMRAEVDREERPRDSSQRADADKDRREGGSWNYGRENRYSSGSRGNEQRGSGNGRYEYSRDNTRRDEHQSDSYRGHSYDSRERSYNKRDSRDRADHHHYRQQQPDNQHERSQRDQYSSHRSYDGGRDGNGDHSDAHKRRRY